MEQQGQEDGQVVKTGKGTDADMARSKRALPSPSKEPDGALMNKKNENWRGNIESGE